MQPLIDTSVRLRRRPLRDPAIDDFAVVHGPVRLPRPGELVLRTIYTSVDPATRLRPREGKSCLPPCRLGDVIGTCSACEVLQSGSPAFAPGDLVTSFTGWQLHPVAEATHVRAIDPAGIALPASSASSAGWNGEVATPLRLNGREEGLHARRLARVRELLS